MKKILRAIALLLITFSASSSVYPSGTPGPDDTIIIQEDDNDEGNNHLPHRAPGRNNAIPEVCFNSDDNTITFISSSPTSFTYTIYGIGGNAVKSGAILLNGENTSETVNIGCNTAGEYTITITLNGKTYSGSFTFVGEIDL